MCLYCELGFLHKCKQEAFILSKHSGNRHKFILCLPDGMFINVVKTYYWRLELVRSWVIIEPQVL